MSLTHPDNEKGMSLCSPKKTSTCLSPRSSFKRQSTLMEQMKIPKTPEKTQTEPTFSLDPKLNIEDTVK